MIGGTGVASDVTEVVRAQREAEQARIAAITLAQVRSDFVASVSHELRTPLTAILGYGELLEARWDQLDDPRRRDWLRRILVSASRQRRLVEDLLLLANMDQPLAASQLVAVNLAQLAREVAEEIQGTYPGQRIDLEGPLDLCALADHGRATQILAHLVDNAAKYSPEGSPIWVTWRQQGAAVLVSVRDAGSGIAGEGRERLFTRFGRLPESRVRAGHVGTGLGLHLGRQLARAMEEDLVLENTGPGGSTFCLQLLNAQAGAAEDGPRAKQDSERLEPLLSLDGDAAGCDGTRDPALLVRRHMTSLTLDEIEPSLEVDRRAIIMTMARG